MEASEQDPIIYTVGHSTHELPYFLGLLQQHGITCIADVRSSPYSRWQPQYNRESIAAALKQAGVEYRFMGAELGARSEDRSCYDNGKVVYSRLAAAAGFQHAIESLQAGTDGARIALMCAEQEPLECHRTLLVARSLESAGSPVGHILGDGRLETHRQTMLRLLKLLKMPEQDLFHTTDEIIEEACDRQEQRIAYVDAEMLSADTAGQRKFSI